MKDPVANPSIKDLLSDPLWVPYSLQGDSVVFKEITTETYKNSVFLDRRSQNLTGRQVVIPMHTLLSSPTPALETVGRHIFHISHVGSTFAATLLDRLPDVTVLREPQILRELAALSHGIRDGGSLLNLTRLKGLLHFTLAKLTQSGSHELVIKNTSGNLTIAPLILSAYVTPPKAIGLYTSLRHFIAHGISSNGLKSDAVGNVGKRITFLNRLADYEMLHASSLNLLQIFSITWMAEMMRLVSVAQSAPDFLMIHFDAMAGNKRLLTESVMRQFYPGCSEETIASLIASDVWDKNAKHKEAFSFKDRQDKIDRNAAQFHTEIASCLTWANRYCADNLALRGLLAHIE